MYDYVSFSQAQQWFGVTHFFVSQDSRFVGISKNLNYGLNIKIGNLTLRARRRSPDRWINSVAKPIFRDKTS